MPLFNREELKRRIQEAAGDGVFIGTSSWKYPGWCGKLYDEARYVWRNRFAHSRFERNCLAEYAEVFKTVSVDASYYTFPTEPFLQGLASQVPKDFLFGFKVTDEITAKRFPNLPRFGLKAGALNPNFLNAELFVRNFLDSCELIRPNVGLLIFEFSKFYSSDFEHGREFVSALDEFLGRLPKGWSYGVEIRNRNWLQPEYFQCLTRHQVAHVFNSWTDMPAVSEQMAMDGSVTNPKLVAARFLLKPGRTYEEAVNAFQPYQHTKELNLDVRRSGAKLIQDGKGTGMKWTYIFVNNRLEGNALQTIAAMLGLDWDS
jgi:uncharacterized protein YecE (DUF72 family)